MKIYCLKCGNQDLIPRATQEDLIQARHEGWMEGYSKCAKTSSVFMGILIAIALGAVSIYILK